VTTFCLIHGSGQGPQGWNLLAHELEARGHGFVTPAIDLGATDAGAAWHADTLVEKLKCSGHVPEEVVCVAHSASGMYLPLVAERWLPRRMVFLAALIPRPGISIVEQYRADPSMFNAAWIGKNSMMDEVALEFVYHDCPANRLAWALSTRVYFYAKRAMEEPCPLAMWPSVPATYIACAEDRTIAPAWQRKAAREWLGTEPVELPSGHCPHVSRPEDLAEVLEMISV
jgi:pimeloyl-ACP methyl ester carboxylesterase